MYFRLIASVCFAFGALAAAERPLGLVKSTSATAVTVSFDAGATIDPGTVLAVYAPARVERHPLTNDVIIEGRKLIAKIQVVSIQAGVCTSRVAWIEPGSEIVAGLDCVPLPGEAAPNAVPVAAAPSSTTVTPGSSITVTVPVTDPDGDPMWYRWSIVDDNGQRGHVVSPVTTTASNQFIAPLMMGKVTIEATATDPLGQSVVATLTVDVAGAIDARGRMPQRLSRFGLDQRLSQVQRGVGGRWMAIDTYEGRLVSYDQGWLYDQAFKPLSDQEPSVITAFDVSGGLIHVLDASSRCVHVYEENGKRVRKYGDLSRPTDLEVADNGVAYIADMGNGGVMVYEADGKFRCRLGREGKEDDSFSKLDRIALATDGTLACLDLGARRVLRFDRYGHRLPTWKVGGDAAVEPVDLAWSAAGLLIQMGDGRILIVDAGGLAKEAYSAPVSKSWDIEIGEPNSLFVDITGELYSTHGREGTIVRRNAAGIVDGIRSQAIVSRATSILADGRGYRYGIQPRDAMVRIMDPTGFMTGHVTAIAKDLADAAVSPDGSALYVLDARQVNVRRYSTADLTAPPVVIGSAGRNSGQFKDPVKLAVDEAGRVYVIDSDTHRVAVFDREGRFLQNITGADKGPSFLDDPTLVAVSPNGDACYVYDADTYEVRKFVIDQAKNTSSFVTNMGGRGDSPGQFRTVQAIGCDRMGNLYAVDSRRSDIQLVDFTGSNAVVLQTWKFEKALGTSSIDYFSAGPDAGFIAASTGSGIIYTW